MRQIRTEELHARRMRDDDLVLINTLPEEYFAATQIPGAINIPEHDDDFIDRVYQAAGSKHRTVVVYCANEECPSSTNAARKLVEAGFTSVYDYESGAAGWRDAGNRLMSVAGT